MPDPYWRYKENLSGDFFIQHKITTANEKTGFHIHDAFEALLILSDGMRCVVGEKTYFLNRNTLLLFNNMDLHFLNMLPEATINDRYLLYFKPEYIQALSSASTNLLECFFYRPFDDAQILTLQADEAQELLALLLQIDAQYHGTDSGDTFGWDLLLKFLLGQFLVKVNLLYRRRHNLSAQTETNAYSQIYSVLHLIHQNYAEPLTLDFLASHFFINKYYLCSLFKKVTGMSPNQYLINCRIMKAKELLMNRYSVDEVCRLTGYKSLSHFSRSFKQHTGKGPKKYQLDFLDGR